MTIHNPERRQISSKNLSIIGAGLEGTGAVLGFADGPKTLRRSTTYQEFFSERAWAQTHTMDGEQAKEAAALKQYLVKLGQSVQDACLSGKKLLVFSGDHTAAIGTWSGVHAALKESEPEGRLGLMWLDAHMDVHTAKTSHSGNWHGMPLATLMGEGDPNFTQLMNPTPKVRPENVVLVGIRSYEDEEKELIDRLGVRVIYAKEIERRNLKAAMEEALWVANSGTVGYGISFDLDFLDPKVAPGVGTPVEDGLGLEATLEALGELDKSNLLAVEIAEFNPGLDSQQMTERAALEIAHTLMS